MKSCECCCGRPAPIASKTSTAQGRAKGVPLRFVHGHHRRGARKYADIFEQLFVRSHVVGECLVLPTANPREYGVVSVSGEDLYAHRVVYELEHGPIPAGMEVCHTCDVRACFWPAHLFSGTRKTNMMDMAAKGRGGKSMGGAKLTPGQVRQVRAAPIRRGSGAQWARRFGVTPSAISSVVRGRTWAAA